MKPIVVDCSVALAWSVESQATPFTIECERVVRDASGHVPFLFPVELGNALLMLERRGKLTATQVNRAVEGISDIELEIDVTSLENAATILILLARSYRLTLYDAAYLELALRTELPLATRDTALATAAKKAGALLFAP